MNRKFYCAPTIEVESFVAEQGFATSTATVNTFGLSYEEENVVW